MKEDAKGRIIPVLLVVLVVLQLNSCSAINSLRKDVQNANNQVHFLQSHINSEISWLRFEIEETLTMQASPIETASFTVGAPPPGETIVPVTFTVVPKEISADTFVSLDFDGETFLMEREGPAFSATVYRDIFENVSPMILIEENGIVRTTQDNRINVESPVFNFFPRFFPSFGGSSTFRNNVYIIRGEISLERAENPNPFTGVSFDEINLVVTLDGEVFSDERISGEVMPENFPLDKEIPLYDGQTIKIAVVATDSIGLKHHFVVQHMIASHDRTGQPARMIRGMGGTGMATIYSADGERLWGEEPWPFSL